MRSRLRRQAVLSSPESQKTSTAFSGGSRRFRVFAPVEAIRAGGEFGGGTHGRPAQNRLDEQIGWAAVMRSPFMATVRKVIEAERKKRAGQVLPTGLS
jgi:hypothetical protein